MIGGMDSEQDFRQLVRQRGILFSHDVGQGPEEWVLAIATPMLTRTQVATPADLAAAGFARSDAQRRLEAERDRLVQLLEAAERQRLAIAAAHQARGAELEALEARARLAEAWKAGEQAGIVARNLETPLEANPHDAESPDPAVRELHLAWRHGWRLREVLLDLNGKYKEALAGSQAVTGAQEALAVEAKAAREAQARAEAEARAAAQEAAELRQGLAAQLGRVGSLEAAMRTIWAEAPHAPTCALRAAAEGTAACNCWRSRLAPPAEPM